MANAGRNMTSKPTYRALFLGAGPQMQCGVGQFTRLLQRAVESSEPGSTTALTLTRSEGWTSAAEDRRPGLSARDALRVKVEDINALAPDYLRVSVGAPHEQPSSRPYRRPLLTRLGAHPPKTGGLPVAASCPRAA